MDKRPDSWQSQPYKVRIAAGGRIVIPAEVRQELGVSEGDELLLTRSEHGIRVTTVDQVVREAQAYFRQFKRPGESVIDELIREREAEAAGEEDESGVGRNRKGR
jgi:AbrB family transcriptional regulator (stage V sporulation protein T)